MAEYDYLIVGGGLYGAVCARELTDKGYKCAVFEKRGGIGGNIRTEEIEGINVHMYGAHIFHTSDKRVWEYVNRFARFNNFINSPIARYKDECYNLPFNMNTFTKLWKDVFTPSEACARIESERAGNYTPDPANLEQQAVNLVGVTLYEKLIKGYTEKQWGAPCSELPAFIIKRLPVRFTFDNNYFSDRMQGIPEGGYTAMINNMLDGVEIHTGCDFLKNREELSRLAPKIIYTGAIDGYFGYRLGALGWRSLRFETEVLPVENFQGNAVVNYTDAEVPYTRIIEHKHFEFKTGGKTVITREYPERWQEGSEPCYPVNNEKNNDIYSGYLKLARMEKNVFFGGRLGSYKYADMDDTVKDALLFCDGVPPKKDLPAG